MTNKFARNFSVSISLLALTVASFSVKQSFDLRDARRLERIEVMYGRLFPRCLQILNEIEIEYNIAAWFVDNDIPLPEPVVCPK